MPTCTLDMHPGFSFRGIYCQSLLKCSILRAGKMAQRVEVLVTKDDHLVLILGTHIVGGESQLPQVVL